MGFEQVEQAAMGFGNMQAQIPATMRADGGLAGDGAELAEIHIRPADDGEQLFPADFFRVCLRELHEPGEAHRAARFGDDAAGFPE